MTRIKDLPENERPRERLRGRGAEALSETELLAILIDRGAVGRSALDAARDLLARLGSLEAVSSASVDAIRETAGIGETTVTTGTLSANLLPPREVLKHALARGAAGVVVVHNHPSGDPTPSREDLDATDRLAAAARAVGVDLVDHVVVASGGTARILGPRRGPRGRRR